MISYINRFVHSHITLGILVGNKSELLILISTEDLHKGGVCWCQIHLWLNVSRPSKGVDEVEICVREPCGIL